jgi:hypothetical protein
MPVQQPLGVFEELENPFFLRVHDHSENWGKDQLNHRIDFFGEKHVKFDLKSIVVFYWKISTFLEKPSPTYVCKLEYLSRWAP